MFRGRRFGLSALASAFFLLTFCLDLFHHSFYPDGGGTNPRLPWRTWREALFRRSVTKEVRCVIPFAPMATQSSLSPCLGGLCELCARLFLVVRRREASRRFRSERVEASRRSCQMRNDRAVAGSAGQAWSSLPVRGSEPEGSLRRHSVSRRIPPLFPFTNGRQPV